MWWGWKPWLGLLAVVLLINLPWYIAVCVQLPEFATYFFWEHNVLRFLAPFDHIEPVWYYIPVVLAGTFPASLLGIAWVRFLISGDVSRAARRTLPSGFYLLAGAWCILFFSLSGSKLPTYVLPAFPALSLAFGAFFFESGWIETRWTRAAVAVCLVALAVGHYVAIPWYARFRSPMSRADEVARYCADRPVICYPRNCDSVAFYLGRDDLMNYRSKETPQLIQFAQTQESATVLFTHRHSSEALRLVLEANGMRLTGLTRLSGSWTGWFQEAYCYMGIIENRLPEATARR
jgi:hypothetical protein